MTDSYGDPQQRFRSSDGSREGGRGGFRGGRGPGGREGGGGFRIRLSDNEMRAARALQEAFNLRSTVAVLGFAIRTLGLMLEEGKLETLLHEYKSQGNQRTGGKGDSNPSNKRRFEDSKGRNEPRPNPFARPEKPQPSIEQSRNEAVDPKEAEEASTEAVDPGIDGLLPSDSPSEPQETNKSEESSIIEKEKSQQAPNED